MSLDADVLTEILRRVDGKTLAKASCASSQFRGIASQESLWEAASYSLCPPPSSLQNPHLHHLISSSLGGFKQFYANCFSHIHILPELLLPIHTQDSSLPSDDHNQNTVSALPSDLMWVVHVQYHDKHVFSKIVWEVPHARSFAEWYLQSPFQTDIVNLEDESPAIMSLDGLGNESEIWRQLTENVKLSWIVINKRTGEAANISSWSPLPAETQLPTSGLKYVVRFGSILPAVDVLTPCKVVKCIVEMKCRVSGSHEDHSNLKMTEVTLRLEDVSGNDVNGKKGLEILERALRYRRSCDRNKILELHRKYFAARRRSHPFKEVCLPATQHSQKSVWIITAIVALFSFYCLNSHLAIV